jgi:PDZ domain-containing protein
MRRAARAGGAVLLVAVALAIGWVPLPLFALGPGPAREIGPLIHVEGTPTHGSSGHLVMTTVRFTKLTPLGAFVTWLDPDRSVVGEDVLYPPGLTPAEEDRRAISQMDQSKIDAASVVLTELVDYPDRHAPGALIEAVGEGCPADRRLFPGDVITRIDGETIDSRREASRLIDAVPEGRPIAFQVETDGRSRDVTIARGPCPGTDEPRLGIALVAAFPLDITIRSGDVGGPSAGLMWAIGLYEALTPGDLTRGRTIAGTGAIDLDGNVGPIGGIGDKVVAAREIRADVLLIPRENLAEVRGVDAGETRVIPVSTFDEAVRALEAIGTES